MPHLNLDKIAPAFLRLRDVSHLISGGTFRIEILLKDTKTLVSKKMFYFVDLLIFLPFTMVFHNAQNLENEDFCIFSSRAVFQLAN